MKNYFPIILISISFVFSSCGVTQFHYTSNAHLSHYSNSTETEMTVINNEQNRTRMYGVIAARDDGEVGYLLIAPNKANSASRSSQISTFDITRATHIDLPAAEKFSLSLERIISQWENLDNSDGFFYEFSSVPEIEVMQIGENAITYVPSVRFFFNTTNEGSTGELILERINYRTGESLSRKFDMNNLESIEDLQSLIQNGIDFFE